MKIALSGHYGLRRLALSSVPAITMVIITSVYSIVDGYFVSNFAGSTQFASLNLVWPALALISALGLMIGNGGSALVSKTLGEGNVPKANSIFTHLIQFCLETGILVSILVFIFMERIVIALGAEGEMIRLATMYGRIVVLIMPLHILQMAFSSFYMTAERPDLGTKMSLVCGAINIVLDAVLIIGFDLGLMGAAIGTAVALAVGGIYPLVFFRSKRNKTHLRFVPIRGKDWKSIIKSCSNGLSEYVGNIALSIVSIGYNFQLMKYIGEDGVSAYGIIMYVGFIFAAVFIGYNICVSQVISFNYGAGNRLELRSLLKKSLVLVGIGGIAMTAASEIFSPALSRLFVGYDKELCSLTEHALRIYMLSFLLCGYNIFCSAWFTALGNGLISALAAFLRTLVFELSAVLILPSMMGIEGVWCSVCVAEGLAAILTAGLILGFRKKYL